MPPVLCLVGFGLAFESRVILRELSFEVPARGCTVLLGPSGTGKSTLLRTLAGLTAGHPLMRLSGVVSYLGRPCAGANRPALVEQKSQLLVSTVLENLVCEMPDRSRLTRVMQIAKLSTRLERLGQEALLDRLTRPVIDLPVWQQRIVAILRKAMAAPALLMVDEPTANLLPQDAEPVVALLRRLSREMPLLVVMHHLAQTRRMADQVLLIASGVTQESAPTERFFTAPRSEAAQQFLRTGSCPEMGLNPHDEEAPDEPRVDELTAVIVANALEVAQARPVPEAVAAEEPAPVEPPVPPPASSSYRSAAWGPRGFVWLLEGQMAGTPWPGIVRETEHDLQALREVGITRLFSLTEKPFDPALSEPHGIRCAASPMPDMHAPSLAQAVQICQELDRFLAAGERVAVHCKAGLGRTGTVLGAYWIWRQRGQVSGDVALTHIRRLESGMVQSLVQEQFLTLFADSLRAGRLAPAP